MYREHKRAGKREEGRGKREEGRGKREEGRGKREEGRGKREEGRKGMEVNDHKPIKMSCGDQGAKQVASW